MIKRICIIERKGVEHYFVYYESGICRFFDYVTNPIREFINRDDIRRDVEHHDNGAIEWTLTVNEERGNNGN